MFWKIFRLLAVLIILALLLMPALLPGPHRALLPGLFGLTQAAPDIYTDAPERAPEFVELIDAARARVAPVVGPVGAPVFVICTQADCAARFGIRTKGLSLGARRVLLAPDGIDPVIVTHELSHIALHHHLTLRDLWQPRFPIWFDEGLASWVAQDPRLQPYPDLSETGWVRQAQTPKDWRVLIHERGNWQEVYGAATAIVADWIDRQGEAALAELINKVAAGAEFEPVFAKPETASQNVLPAE